MDESRKGSRLRLMGFLGLVAFVVLLGSGCVSRSQQDQRPAWVRESEERFAGKSFSELARGQMSPLSESSGSASAESNSQRTRAKSMPQPEGVQWGETKVTVEVEE